MDDWRYLSGVWVADGRKGWYTIKRSNGRLTVWQHSSTSNSVQVGIFPLHSLDTAQAAAEEFDNQKKRRAS